MTNAGVPFLDLEAQNAPLRTELERAVRGVIESQQFVMGPAVEAFEEAFARYCGTRLAIGCASGSDALLLALMALEIGPGDQVICPAYTFFATASAITRLGATPIFADIDRTSFNLDPEQARKVAARCSRLKAVLPVDLFGQTADMGTFLDLGRELRTPVIEDAAQSVGARDREGRRAGSSAAAGCFSLYPTKNLGAFGDAGIIVTDDDAFAERVRALRVHGSSERYFHSEVGINSRLDTLQAAVLLVKLSHLDDWNAQRREIAAHYDERFAAAGAAATAEEGGPGEVGRLPLEVPRIAPRGSEHVYHHYVIRVDAGRRDALRAELGRQGIGTQVYYPLGLHLQDCFAHLEYAQGDLPETEAASRETLALPIYPGLREAQVERVADAVIDFLGRDQRAKP